MSEIDAGDWQEAMGWVMDQAGKFSAEQRRQAAKTGAALPDGSFPINNSADLKDAIRLVGNGKDPVAAKRHIKRRAAALGLTKLLPEGW